MTKEQYTKLQKWAQQLRWAAKSNFIHLSAAEFNEIAGVYAEVYGEGLTQSQKSCNTCRLKALKRLYNSVFQYEQEIALQQKEENLQEAESQDNKKKPGRKKKIDID